MNYYGKEKSKYFAVGEYADPNEATPFGRPHYHLALYGPLGVIGDDPERTEIEPSRSGGRQFTHTDFAACWPHGLHSYSELSFESAAYVARYCLKKITGLFAAPIYEGRTPEFQRNSNGLGKSHLFDDQGNPRWLSDVYPSDQIVLPGRGNFLPPPYFDRLLEKADPSLYLQVKKKRQEAQEALTSREELLLAHNELSRSEQFITLVTDATLIRSI